MVSLPGVADRGAARDKKKARVARAGAALVRVARGALVAQAGDLVPAGVAQARAVRGGVVQEMCSRGGLFPCVDGGVAPGARREGGFQVWDADSPLVAGQARECLSAAI